MCPATRTQFGDGQDWMPKRQEAAPKTGDPALRLHGDVRRQIADPASNQYEAIEKCKAAGIDIEDLCVPFEGHEGEFDTNAKRLIEMRKRLEAAQVTIGPTCTDLPHFLSFCGAPKPARKSIAATRRCWAPGKPRSSTETDRSRSLPRARVLHATLADAGVGASAFRCVGTVVGAFLFATLLTLSLHSPSPDAAVFSDDQHHAPVVEDGECADLGRSNPLPARPVRGAEPVFAGGLGRSRSERGKRRADSGGAGE